MRVPQTKYARTTDGLRLAYQQWGDGPRLMIVPALLSKMEVVWELEYFVRIHDLLGRYVTVAGFDKRGMHNTIAPRRYWGRIPTLISASLPDRSQL